MIGTEFNDLGPHAKAVQTATSVEELSDAIARLHHVARPWGVWQDPRALAACLVEVRRLAQDGTLSSFLEVGTGWGYSFFVIDHFLRTHAGMTGVTIDDMNFVISEVSPFLRQCRFIMPLQALASRQVDVVFFDGRKSLADLKADYRLVGTRAKVCVFAAAGPEVREWWKELEQWGRRVVDLDGAGLLLSKNSGV